MSLLTSHRRAVAARSAVIIFALALPANLIGALFGATSSAAQSADSELPEVEVLQSPVAEASRKVSKKTKPATEQKSTSGPKPTAVTKAPESTAADTSQNATLDIDEASTEVPLQVSGTPALRSGSLTVPTTAEAAAELARTPGAVDVVSDEEFRKSTPATTIKDVLDYVPGVIVQPKWGEDSRLSIRGSGLSRNFHLRGVQLYMDGIPINTADGFGDFQEIDPTAYRYVEVYKGSNALRFGANSLGGAINFVIPTGYDSDLFGSRLDVGSFGFRKLSASSGGVHGPVDYFITGTWQQQDGFRDHSDGESVRGAMNLGYRLSENIETRFYLNANTIEQRIPGSVTKQSALRQPQVAAVQNVVNDYQRNIDSFRISNKTTVRLDTGTTLELGGFYINRHLMHPIFRWLDYRYDDYGGFARLYDERLLGGHKNRFIAGVNLHNGDIDARQFANGPGAARGPLLTQTKDSSRNLAFYAENSFYLTDKLAAVVGTQFLHAERATDAVIGATSGRNSFDLWSPKAGLLYELTPSAQIFANVSRSAEIPSFGENRGIGSNEFDASPQRATTYEIGTRGGVDGFNWDLTLYRSAIDNELLCVAPFPVANFCIVANADRTIHQGVEAGVSARLLDGVFNVSDKSDSLWVNAAYTFSDFHFDGDALFGDNDLPGAPRHFLRAELLYKHAGGLYVGPNVEWVPTAYYVDSANTLDTEAYAIWGAKIGFDNGGSWSAYLEGRNLFDVAYIASTGITNVADPNTTAQFEPGTGRAVYGGFQYRW